MHFFRHKILNQLFSGWYSRIPAVTLPAVLILIFSAATFAQKVVTYPEALDSDTSNYYLVCDSVIWLKATKPLPGDTGKWTFKSGTGTFLTSSTADSVLVHLKSSGKIEIYWRIPKSPGPPVINFFFLNNGFVSTPKIQIPTDNPTCSDSIKLTAVKPANGTGKWKSTAAGIIIKDPGNYISDIKKLPKGNTKIFWEVTSPACPVKKDSIVIVNLSATKPFAGEPKIVCSDQASLFGNPVGSDETGTWKASSPLVNILSPNSHQTTANNLQVGDNRFEWKISNDECISSGFVIIRYNKPNEAAIITKDTTVCSDKISLQARPVAGGSWSVTAGSGLISDKFSPNITVSGLREGENKFTWTVLNPNCSNSGATVTILNQSVTKPVTVRDTCLIFNGQKNVSLRIKNNLRSGEFGEWSSLDHSGEISFKDNQNNTASFSPHGSGYYKFKFTVKNNTNCKNSDSTHYAVLTKAEIPLPVTKCVFTDRVTGLASDFITPLSSPALSEGETGKWQLEQSSPLIVKLDTSTAANGKLNFNKLPPGTYKFKWTIVNTKCIGCDGVKCPNSAVITMSVLKNAIITTDRTIPCTYDSSITLNAVNPFPSGLGVWTTKKAGEFLPRKDTIAVLAKNFPKGRNSILWEVTDIASGCKSSDSIIIYRLTKPNAGTDTCFASSSNSSDDNILGKLKGNVPDAGLNEKSIWYYANNSAIRVLDPVAPNSIGIKSSPPGNYVLRYSIYNDSICSTMPGDTIKLTFVATPKPFNAEYHVLPLSQKIILTGQPSALSPTDTLYWVNSAYNKIASGTTYTLPDTIKAGLYLYRFVIKNKFNMCSALAVDSVRIITNPKITAPACLKFNVNSISLDANPIAAGESARWYYKDSDNRITSIADEPGPSRQFSFNSPNKLKFFRSILAEGKVRATDSLVITKLTGAVPQLENTCSVGSVFILKPKPLFLKPYESAVWIKADTLNKAVRFQNGKSYFDTLINLPSGQQNIKLVIKDHTPGSSCIDTSTSFVAVVSVSKPVAGDDICTTDSDALLHTPQYPNESYLWKKNIDTISMIHNPRVSLNYLENDFVITTKSALSLGDAANCFASDTLKITRITPARVFNDTCIRGSDSILLKGNTYFNGQTAGWFKGLLIHDTARISSSDQANYQNLKQGLNVFSYSISFKACSNTSSLKAVMVSKARIDSFQTCLTIPVSGTLTSKITVNKASPDTQTSYKWVKDISYNDSVFTSDSTNYNMLMKESGRRLYKWMIVSNTDPGCFTQDSVKFTVIPKATTGSDTCIKSDNDNALVYLKGSAVNPLKGETGKWTSVPLASITDSSKASAFSMVLVKGRTTFKWMTENGSCRDSTLFLATHIDKAEVFTNDSCMYYNQNLSLSLNRNLIDINKEDAVWSSGNSALVIENTSGSAIASGLSKGLNTFRWKVASKENPACFDTDSVKFSLLTLYNKISDTVYICTSDTALITPVISDQETETWSLNSAQNTYVLKSENNRLKLPKLSNDTIYTLTREISPRTSLSCALADSFRISNRQLDSVFSSSPSEVICQSTVSIQVKRPKSDLPEAIGFWTLLEQPFPNNASFQRKDSTANTITYDLIDLAAKGIYKFLWTSYVPNCQRQSVEYIIEKKDIFSTPPHVQSVCNLKTFSFKDLDSRFKIIPDADSVQWFRDMNNQGNFKLISTSLNKDSIVIENLFPRDNNFKYTVTKNGCQGSILIFISNDEQFDLNPGLKNNIVSVCEQDSLLITARHNLLGSKSQMKTNFSFTKSIDFIDPEYPLNRNFITGDDSTTVSVKNINKILNRPRILYIMAKNADCPQRTDSIILINSKQINYVNAGNDDTVCTNTILLKGKSDFKKGYWSSVTGNALSFLNDTSVSAAVSGGYLNTFLYTVTNGECVKSDTVKYYGGDLLSPANVIFDSLKICDSAVFHLSAVKPLYGAGEWILHDLNFGTNSENSSNFPFNAAENLKDREKADFIWRVYNNFCSNKDTMQVNYFKTPSKAVAGQSQNIVKDNFIMEAKAPEFGSGEWKVLKGTGIIEESGNPKSVVNKLIEGENIFTWTVTNGTCVPSSDQVVIIFSDFNIPNGFSPNGDNKNDRFEIKGLESYPDSKLKVFNRWGSLVYSSGNYKNDWDGEGLSDDTYFYELMVPGSKDRHGYVLLKRK